MVAAVSCAGISASMRPPEFTGGNPRALGYMAQHAAAASMRPPEFTGGNVPGRVSMAPADGLQ